MAKKTPRAAAPDLPLIEDDAAATPMADLGLLKPQARGTTQTAPDPTRPIMRADGSAVVPHEEPDGDEKYVEQADGSVVVLDDPEDERRELNGDHLDNLVEALDPAVRTRFALDLLDAVERDVADRKERDNLYAEALQRSGLGQEAPGGAQFQGASKVVHPMLTQACIDFASRTMKEVFPAKGPVKAHIIGTATREKIERAERKKTYMNWQCTKQIREFRHTFETLLTQVPLGGSQYLKVWYSERFKRPRTEFIPVDKMALPAAAAVSFADAERKTHIQEITRLEFDQRVRAGLYIDIPKGEPSDPEQTAAEKANDKIEGKATSSMNEDGLRTLYEVYITTDELELDGDQPSPYIATIDKTTGQLIGLYRNWAPDDELRIELPWIVEAQFVPWRGPYGLGLIHIAGSLSAAATGALRALLDSALVANFPGALKLSGAKMAGQTQTVEPTQIQEIEGPVGVDDIRKLAMPFPFPGPSPTLFQLLEYMVNSGMGVIATAEDKIADVSSNAPVGTTLAMIEQGSITYSSVHARMHRTMEQFLEILHRIDGEWLDDEVTVAELGELVVRREDFQGPMDVVPVSDPNIFSETQRYAQLQAVLQLRAQFAPGTFKDPALIEQAMRLINYPQYEDVLNTPLEAEERDPLQENYIAGEPQSQLQAYDAQDHLAHLRAHVKFMASPVFAANPLMAAPALPKLMDHCKQHLRMYYLQHARAASQAVMTRASDFEELRGEEGAMAIGAALSDNEMAAELADIMDALQKLQQQMQQLIPPPPDPEVGKEQVKAQSAQTIEKMRLDAQATREAQAAAAEQAREQRREAAEATRHTEEMAVAAANARTAEQSEQMKQMMQTHLEQLRIANERAAEQLRADMQLQMTEMKNRSAEFTALIQSMMQARTAAATAEATPTKDAEGGTKTPSSTEARKKLDDTISELLDVMKGVLAAQQRPRAPARLRKTTEGYVVEDIPPQPPMQ